MIVAKYMHRLSSRGGHRRTIKRTKRFPTCRPTCPSRETLLQYSLGLLSGRQRDALDSIWTPVPTARRRS